MTPRKIARARERYDQGDLTVAEIAKSLGASRASVTANCLRRTMGAFKPLPRGRLQGASAEAQGHDRVVPGPAEAATSRAAAPLTCRQRASPSG